MKRFMTLALMPAVWIPLVAAAAGPAQAPAPSSPPSTSPERETELLRARIAELEKAVSAAKAAQSPALPPPPSNPAPASSGPSASPAPAAVSTAAARDAGLAARAGAGDPAVTKALLDLVARRDGPGLAKEVGRLLSSGEPARATLYDFLVELDRDSRQALLLTYDYRLSFSLSQAVALHEDEIARFAHYFLAASQGYSESHGTPRSTLRRTLFDYLPVLLRYHKGRYPDLERDMEGEILRRLTERKGDLQMYFSAMESLGYKPPIEVLDPLLERASSHAETLPVALHLEARNDGPAARILSRNITRNPPGMEWKALIMLGSLARMSTPEASKALAQFAQSFDEHIRPAAMQAYFRVPRDVGSLVLLRDFLEGDGRIEDKRSVIHVLRRGNPHLLEALKKESGGFRSEEVRKLLTADEPSQGAKESAR
jgi:hypothetical protein